MTVGSHSALHAYLAPGQRMEAQGARGAEADTGSNDPAVREDKAGCGTCFTLRIVHSLEEQCNTKVDGTAGPSLLTTLFEETEEGRRRTIEDERAMKGIASVLYAGEKVHRFRLISLIESNIAGTDTVSAGLIWVRARPVY